MGFIVLYVGVLRGYLIYEVYGIKELPYMLRFIGFMGFIRRILIESIIYKKG